MKYLTLEGGNFNILGAGGGALVPKTQMKTPAVKPLVRFSNITKSFEPVIDFSKLKDVTKREKVKIINATTNGVQQNKQAINSDYENIKRDIDQLNNYVRRGMDYLDRQMRANIANNNNSSPSLQPANIIFSSEKKKTLMGKIATFLKWAGATALATIIASYISRIIENPVSREDLLANANMLSNVDKEITTATQQMNKRLDAIQENLDVQKENIDEGFNWTYVGLGIGGLILGGGITYLIYSASKKKK